MAAFRAGEVGGGEWDASNIGRRSMALGGAVVASGTGAVALGNEGTASGEFSTVMGSQSHASGEVSTALGHATIASGANSTAMGRMTEAGGNSSLAAGFRTVASGNYSTALGANASTNGFSGSFVFGDVSTFSFLTDVNATANNQFLVRAAGGFRFRTSADLSTGCDLPAGSGTFACTSDRNRKQDFQPVDGEWVLSRVAGTPVTSWSYITEESRVRHIGPTAQDFRAAFGLGTDDTTIGMIDIDGVNLAAVQALALRTHALQAENVALRADREALRAEVRALQTQAR
jgi:hypothetical protein